MFHARGFTLIEVLISMVILAIGLLGLAAMQAVSLRDNLDSYNYQQATLLAYEMQDRIKGNQPIEESEKFKWTDVIAGTGDVCTKIAPCTQAIDMAANDYGYWKNRVSNELPKLKDGTTATAEIADSNGQGGGCKNADSTTKPLCLITTWGRANNKDSSKGSKLSDTAKFYLEVTP